MVKKIDPVRLVVALDRIEAKKPRIGVIGDVMLDRYIFGDTDRISPEAPIPVVDVTGQANHLGGAANVANNLIEMGASVSSFGVVGDDEAGLALKQAFSERELRTDGLITDKSRPTTTKLRIFARAQQVARADFESRAPLAPEVRDLLLARLDARLAKLDALVLEDYNKGVLTEELIALVLERAAARKLPVLVDPKVDNFFAYQGVAVFKPNRAETQRALGVKLDGRDAVEAGARALQQKLGCENVLLTMSEKGMALLDREGHFYQVPAKVKIVHDPSGAGDTVIAAMAISLASGIDPVSAMVLANYAGGVIVGKVGVQPVSLNEIRDAVIHHDGKVA